MEQNFLKSLFFMFSYVFHDRIIAYSKNFPSENDGNLYNLRAAVGKQTCLKQFATLLTERGIFLPVTLSAGS